MNTDNKSFIKGTVRDPIAIYKKSNRKKLYFSVNAANLVKQSTNTKCSMSRPAANAAISGMSMPMVNLKIKVKNNQGGNLATLCAFPDTGASVDCIKENS